MEAGSHAIDRAASQTPSLPTEKTDKIARGVRWFAPTLGASAAERMFSCLRKWARMSAAGTVNEFVNPDRTLAKKGLAFHSNQSVCADVRGSRMTTGRLRPGARPGEGPD
jgi:hypothetical protein